MATQSAPRPGGRLSFARIVAALAVASAVILYAMSFASAADVQALRTTALVVLGIGLLATQAIPEHITALLILFLAVATRIAPNEIVFSGFSVGGLWLLFSGIIIGAAVGEAKLGVYTARRLMSRVTLTYTRAVVLTVVVGTLLGFIMPATIPRIIILMPIALGLAEAMGLEEGGRGYTGLAVAVIAGTLFPTLAIMTANLPTVVHVSAIEENYGLTLPFAAFFTYHGPISILRAVAIIAIVIAIFRESEPPTALKQDPEPITPQQRRLFAVLFCAVALWLTDFIHGIAPAWIALGVAIVVLLPVMRLLPPTALKERVDFSPVLLVAGVLCIGALMRYSGLDATLGSAIVENSGLTHGNDVLNFYATVAIAFVMCLVVTAPAVPVMLVPLAKQLSETTGLGLTATLMAQFVGLSTLIFPYQAPPLIVGLSLCKIRVGDLVKTCALLSLIVFFLGAPLTYAWWRYLGLIE